MKEATHTRRGKVIVDLGSGAVSAFKSINQAKSASHEIQKDSDNALGRGTVRLLARKQSERAKSASRQLSQEASERLRSGR